MRDWNSLVRQRLSTLDLGLAREEAIAEELGAHLEWKFDELVREGASEDEAFRTVTEDLSDEKLRREFHAMFSPAHEPLAPGSTARGGFWSGIGHDVRLAWRQLISSPGFALVALLSLGLGVGANTAIFALIDAVVMRTLPVPDPQRLAELTLNHKGRIGATVGRQEDFSSALWEQVERRQQGFSGLAAWSGVPFDLGNGGEARGADGLFVSGRFFDVLGVRPVLGRLIEPSDDLKGCGIQGAVISYGFWQSEFGGRVNAVGSEISLDRHAFQIIGVAPPTFTGLEVGRKFDVAVPLCSEPALHADPGSPANASVWTNSATTWWLAAIGRLKPGWSFERATAQLRAVSPGIFAATIPSGYDAISRENYLRFSVVARPAATGVSSLRQEYEQPLWLLLAISGMVLLIACANIANLMLARATARQHEMAVRLALGATRARIVRQLLVESLLLAVLGTAAGALAAQFLGRMLIAGIGTSHDSVFLSLAPDGRMLAFTAGLALATCIAFGVAPALHASNAEPGTVVKTSARGITTGRERSLTRRVLIVTQISLSLVLVVAALLFLRTFRNLEQVNPGFDEEHVLIGDFDASALKLPEAQRLEFKRELLAGVRATPGVTSAAEVTIVPLSGNGWDRFLDVPDRSIQRKVVNLNSVSADYFRTLRIPLMRGRDFNDDDRTNAPAVAIVNQSLAKALFNGENAVGRSFGIQQDSGKPDKMVRIVGVVGDTNYYDLREERRPIAYLALSQTAEPDLDSTFVIRSDEDATALVNALKAAAAKMSPRIVLSFSWMKAAVREQLGRERMMAELSGFYGGLAALLATIGIYGVMAYSVVRRRREIGIRMALGATQRQILRMILREAFAILTIGVATGAALVFACGRVVRTMLYGLKAFDPETLAAAIGGLALITLVASLLPARRASAIQPMQTLREE